MSASFVEQHPVRGLLRMLMRLPIVIYRLRMGWMFGNRLLLLTTTGRNTGLPRQAVVEVVHHDTTTGAYTIASGWGGKSDWFCNIQKSPQVIVTIGSKQFNATASLLCAEEAEQILSDYAQLHPIESRSMTWLFAGKNLSNAVDQSHAIASMFPLVVLVPQKVG